MFKRFWWVFIVMVPIGALTGLLVAALVTYVMPKMYESVATIEVRLPPDQVSAQNPTDGIMPSSFFLAEIEKLRKRTSLARIADVLGLAKSWNMDGESTLLELEKSIDCGNVVGSNLIQVRACLPLKHEARDVVAGLILTFREEREKPEDPSLSKRVTDLDKQVMGQLLRLDELVEEWNSKGMTTAGWDWRNPPWFAKSAIDPERRKLEVMQNELEVATQLAKASSAKVILHDAPKIQDSPVSPNVTRNLMVGKLLGILLSPLMAVPVIWIQNRLKPAKV